MARVESEAGIIATLIHHPEFSYYSEQLLPNHFTNEENRYIYQAICSLARDGITTIDPYNIILTLVEYAERFIVGGLWSQTRHPMASAAQSH